MSSSIALTFLILTDAANRGNKRMNVVYFPYISDIPRFIHFKKNLWRMMTPLTKVNTVGTEKHFDVVSQRRNIGNISPSEESFIFNRGNGRQKFDKADMINVKHYSI